MNMIAQLDWRDFEIMVDLIFARGGWQRSSAVGDGEVDVDLMLTSPTTGETAWVQIKSSAAQAVLDDYIERFHRDGSCDRFFFVCHSPKGTLTLPISEMSLSHCSSSAGEAISRASSDRYSGSSCDQSATFNSIGTKDRAGALATISVSS